jgi:dTDP-4-amino-4,6-dideoxygalactose transaminase
MYDTIRKVIEDAVTAAGYGSYASQYSRVIDAAAADVATHVSKCGEDVMTKLVTDDDMDADEVRALFVENGLAVEREPEVAASDTGMEARMTRIEEAIARLSAVAERAEQYLR